MRDSASGPSPSSFSKCSSRELSIVWDSSVSLRKLAAKIIIFHLNLLSFSVFELCKESLFESSTSESGISPKIIFS